MEGDSLGLAEGDLLGVAEGLAEGFDIGDFESVGNAVGLHVG